MKNLILTTLALLGGLAAVSSLPAQTYTIPWHTIGPGGTSAGGIYSVRSSVGQWDAGNMSGGNLSLAGGFWALAGGQAGALAPYNIADLGTFGGTGADGYPGAEPYNLNNLGQIVGYSYPPGNAYWHAAFWTNSVASPLDLGALGGGFSEAQTISDSGQIVGEADFASGYRPFHAATWASSTAGALDLGSFGGDSQAQSVNESGQIAGWSYFPGNTNYHAVFWPNTNSPPLDMGTLGGASSEATWINEYGQIVGNSNPAGSELVHAAFWANGSSASVDLGTLGYDQSLAFSINKSGQIVGEGVNSAFSSFQAIFWTNSHSMGFALNAPGSLMSAASGINASGQIVGWAGSGWEGSSAVLWTNSSSPAIDLNTLIPANSGWVLEYANAINDKGEIVGVGTFNGQERGFALTLVNPAVGIGPMPALLITSAARIGYTLQLSFVSDACHSYNIQTTSDLTSGAWSTILIGVPGNGGIVQLTIPEDFIQPWKFFRVQQAP